MRCRAALLLTFALLACNASVSPTPDSTSARIASQGATAVALSKPPPVPTALGAPPTAVNSVAVEGRVVFIRNDALTILENGQTRQIFKAPSGGQVKDPVWSPDGRSIAFAFAPPRPPSRSGAPIVEQLLTSDVMMVDADGQNARVIVAHDRPGQILETPAWSGDGKSIYYSFYAPTYRGEQLVSETIEVQRRELGAATNSTAARDASNPGVSRDGKWLAFVNEDPEGPALKVAPVAGGEPRTLIKPDRFASFLAPRFSPDGLTLAFSAASLSSGPNGAQPKASAPLEILRRLITPASAFAHGLPWEIWTIPTAGGVPVQLTQIQEDTPYASWSADGNRMLVYGAGGLHRVDIKSVQTQTLSSEGAHGGMDWRSAP